MDDFAGKIAVVTGGGSGMGQELALQLAAGAPAGPRRRLLRHCVLPRSKRMPARLARNTKLLSPVRNGAPCGVADSKILVVAVQDVRTVPRAVHPTGHNGLR